MLILRLDPDLIVPSEDGQASERPPRRAGERAPVFRAEVSVMTWADELVLGWNEMNRTGKVSATLIERDEFLPIQAQ
jgi:hypothetical protein